MPCSPFLTGITDILEVLRIVRDHPILQCSEPPEVFYPLQEQGWVTYGRGRWSITDEGYGVLKAVTAASPAPKEFFEL